MSNYNWHIHAKAYLFELGAAEFDAFVSNPKRRKRDRYSPTEYHRDLIEYLNADDEEGFKSLKIQRHDYSALGTGELR